MSTPITTRELLAAIETLRAMGPDALPIAGIIDRLANNIEELRHAALLAAGIHGGPGAWRWASDPTGTILDDVAAWERLLGEMRERTGRRAPSGSPSRGGTQYRSPMA